jgi:hypothetical protein
MKATGETMKAVSGRTVGDCSTYLPLCFFACKSYRRFVWI